MNQDCEHQHEIRTNLETLQENLFVGYLFLALHVTNNIRNEEIIVLVTLRR